MKIQELPQVLIFRAGTDTLVTRLINDVNQVQERALGIRQLIRWPILFAAGSISCNLMLDAQLGMVFTGSRTGKALFSLLCAARKSTALLLNCAP